MLNNNNNNNNNNNTVFFKPPKSKKSSAQVPQKTFRGSIKEYLEVRLLNPNITGIEVSGPKKTGKGFGLSLTPGPQKHAGNYDASYTPNADELRALMNVIQADEIETLSFEAATLTPIAGKILGLALKTNTSLKELKVSSDGLGKRGLIDLMDGLKVNQSLQLFRSRSPNIVRHKWSTEEVIALKAVLLHNRTLRLIELSDNDFSNRYDIRLLADVYDASKRELPTIKGLGGSRVPDFTKENAQNGELYRFAPDPSYVYSAGGYE